MAYGHFSWNQVNLGQASILEAEKDTFSMLLDELRNMWQKLFSSRKANDGPADIRFPPLLDMPLNFTGKEDVEIFATARDRLLAPCRTWIKQEAIVSSLDN